MQLLHGHELAKYIYFQLSRCFLGYDGGTVKVNEFHLRTIDGLLCKTFANREDDLRFVLLLVANADTVAVSLGTGRAERMDEV